LSLDRRGGRIGDRSRGPLGALYRGSDKGEILCGWLQATRNPFFCFEQDLVALSFSQKFLAFRSRLIFFRRFNFSGDRLFQFIDGPMRYWVPAHAGFLAVADQNPSFTGCPTFSRQRTKLMRKRKNLSIGFCLATGTGSLRLIPALILRRAGVDHQYSLGTCPNRRRICLTSNLPISKSLVRLHAASFIRRKLELNTKSPVTAEWTNAPDESHRNDCWRRSLAGENLGEPCARVRR
jgi:hypothetical protein